MNTQKNKMIREKGYTLNKDGKKEKFEEFRVVKAIIKKKDKKNKNNC